MEFKGEAVALCSSQIDRLLGLSEVAVNLGVSRRTVDRLIAARELVVVKVGRRSCVPTSEVVAFIERGKVRVHG